MSQHPFDQSIALQHCGGNAFAGQASAAYWGMASPFGGNTAAQLLHAVQMHPEVLGEPLSVTVNYAAGIQPAAFTIEAVPVRTNRSTQHWQISMFQEGAVVTTATVVTAVPRDTWTEQEMPMPDVAGPQELSARPWGIPKLPFFANYECRGVDGGFPEHWDGPPRDSTTRLWLRDAPPRPLDAYSIVSMADIFFPRVFLRRRPTPAGTVSMTVYLHATARELQAVGTDYVLAQAKGQVYAHGFHDQTASLWSEAGKLLATTHQIVYFKT